MALVAVALFLSLPSSLSPSLLPFPSFLPSFLKPLPGVQLVGTQRSERRREGLHARSEQLLVPCFSLVSSWAPPNWAPGRDFPFFLSYFLPSLASFLASFDPSFDPSFLIHPSFHPSMQSILFFFQIPNHTESDCSLTIISCPYVKTGCEIKVCKFSIFQLPIIHSVCPPNFAWTIVVKCSREVFIFPTAFHNNSLCKIWGANRGK